MAEQVWISTAAGHASNLRPFRTDLSEKESERYLSIVQRIEYGEPIASDDFPQTVFGAPNARENAYELPNLFYAYGYWILSEAARDVLSRFDLGDAMLSPVAVLKKDRQTPVAGAWTCINFGNLKDTIVPEESPKMMHDYIRDGRKGWIPPSATKDGDVAVLPIAPDGPGIWKDPQTRDCFFMLDRVAQGLKKAKVDRGFFLSRCRMVDIA